MRQVNYTSGIDELIRLGWEVVVDENVVTPNTSNKRGIFRRCLDHLRTFWQMICGKRKPDTTPQIFVEKNLLLRLRKKGVTCCAFSAWKLEERRGKMISINIYDEEHTVPTNPERSAKYAQGYQDGKRWAGLQRDASGLGSSDERVRNAAISALKESRLSTSEIRQCYEDGFMAGAEAWLRSSRKV